MSVLVPYAPLDTLKPVADDIWIADGGEVRMPFGPLAVPFTTRMTIVRLSQGRLWLHSPIAWHDGLAAGIARLGAVAFIVAPNDLHHLFVKPWHEAFPQARVFMAQGLAKKGVAGSVLGDAAPDGWAGEIDQRVARGAVIDEAVFFHRASRTLILTDLIENFEPRRVRSRFWRTLSRLAGNRDPDGKAPLDLRLSFAGRRRDLRAVARQMIAWQPERVILAHGRWYDRDGTQELRRAFRWILQD
ncbi:DUF4336 domain-containing protein [Erythrobacter sp. HL-111]|uniref:DUF4336 domain-containing protein n=1 Tax=Erythrobacter sp. HL-111 TaxID=1798193 RepID=UPI0006DB4E81|nr:DUF4336 domain-containing protein [Erythrobacter sp. HL-111]KPP94803.1 MAG: protein of unknown function containing DUF4336 domain [Erythrobacteraceae bacterium HL-111]SDS85889.1 protein of unknown function [Erythrobacter sp. HL-111]